MASAAKSIFIFLASISFHLSLIASKSKDPTPAPWPLQFHSILFMNNSGTLQKVDLWYDWPNGRNFNIIQNQLGKLTYDLEWDNGTSYIYTLDSSNECRVLHFPVGILRPDWLDGANYLGQQQKDGFLCNVWEKVDFIWYYEDVISKTPVFWVFYTGYTAHVMTFEVGAVLEDSQWQAPVYCFEEGEEKRKAVIESWGWSNHHQGKLIRLIFVTDLAITVYSVFDSLTVMYMKIFSINNYSWRILSPLSPLDITT